MLADVNACDCTQVLYEHHKRNCTESRLWEKKKKNPLPHWACISNEPDLILVLRKSFQLSTMLHKILTLYKHMLE